MRRYPSSAMTALALLCAAGLAWTEGLAAQTMGWEELRTVIERSVHLRMADAQTAARLRRIQPVEAVPAWAVEAAASWDAGPLTQRELRRMAEKSADKAAGDAAPMLRHPRSAAPIRDGESAVVLEVVRLYAQEYSESIPNFLCYRNTRFLEASTPLGRWKLDTELKERLSHTENEDKHEIVAVDGEEVDRDTMVFFGGLTVSGEFGNVMRRLFEVETETTFTWLGDEAGNPDRVRLGFVVDEEHSSMRINVWDEGEVVRGYAGEVYASRSTGQIFRVRLTMDELPKGYPLRGATWDIRYGPVKVEEQELLLPTSAAVEASQGGRFVRNEATYTDYQKYTADSSIQFEQTVSSPQ